MKSGAPRLTFLMRSDGRVSNASAMERGYSGECCFIEDDIRDAADLSADLCVFHAGCHEVKIMKVLEGMRFPVTKLLRGVRRSRGG